MIIVFVCYGKGDNRPDSFSVKLFDEKKDALDYIKSVNSPEGKYWTIAQIVADGERVEFPN